MGDDFVSTNVISVARDRGLKPEGVLVNLTVQLTGEKPANEEFLKEELANSLEAASSELSLSNASVSPIIQRVEDVQGKLQTSYFKSITNLVVALKENYCRFNRNIVSIETIFPLLIVQRNRVKRIQICSA